MANTFLNIHSFLAHSTENGPGNRAVVWVQGCTLHCPGCFNPETHDLGDRLLVAVDEFAARIVALPCLEGVTISGGEPFLQAEALAALGALIHAAGLGLMVFSGFTFDELRQSANASWKAFLAQIDLLSAGPFLQAQACDLPLRGSRNQTLHYLSDRYTSQQAQIEQGVSGVEVFIDATGQVTMTGFPLPEIGKF
jgi:anaerobic ribonucleoside-triphosphate reductase activating protein